MSSERGDITADIRQLKRIIKEYYNYTPNKIDNKRKWTNCQKDTKKQN